MMFLFRLGFSSQMCKLNCRYGARQKHRPPYSTTVIKARLKLETKIEEKTLETQTKKLVSVSLQWLLQASVL